MLKNYILTGLFLILASGISVAQKDLSPVVDLILQERYSEAQEVLDSYTAKKKAPKDIDEVYYWLGKIEFLKENFKEAEKFFQKGIEEEEKSVMNYAGLARIRLKEGNILAAKELLGKAEEFDRGKVREYSFQRAEALLEGDAEMAADAKVILYGLKDSDQEDPRPHIGLVNIYLSDRVPELAYEELKSVLAKSPDYVPAYVYLAELKYKDGLVSKKAEHFNQGLEYANKAIELDPSYASAYRIRSEIYLMAKDFEQARKDMEKYVAETQGDLNARVRYASLLFLSEEYQAAVDELNKIEKAGLKNNLMLRLKGLALIELGDLDVAKASMEEYFSKIKDEFTIWQDYKAMGDIYRLKGDLEKADPFYEKAIEKNSEKNALFEEFADVYKEKAETAAPSEALGLYRNEAHYRKKVLEHPGRERYQTYYKYALALYNAGPDNYKEADKYFIKCSELSTKPVNPYNYRLQIARYFENEDNSSTDWLMAVPAQDFVNSREGTEASETGEAEKRFLVACYGILLSRAFNPEALAQPNQDQVDCAAATPIAEKLVALDPENSAAMTILNFCNNR